MIIFVGLGNCLLLRSPEGSQFVKSKSMKMLKESVIFNITLVKNYEVVEATENEF